jgi:hypothetical protein
MIQLIGQIFNLGFEAIEKGGKLSTTTERLVPWITEENAHSGKYGERSAGFPRVRCCPQDGPPLTVFLTTMDDQVPCNYREQCASE